MSGGKGKQKQGNHQKSPFKVLGLFLSSNQRKEQILLFFFLSRKKGVRKEKGCKCKGRTQVGMSFFLRTKENKKALLFNIYYFDKRQKTDSRF